MKSKNLFIISTKNPAIYIFTAIVLCSLCFTSIMIDRQLSQNGHSIEIYAGGENTVVDAASEQTVSPGETFTIPIVVEPNQAIAGIQFSLAFDASLVTVDSIQEGNLLDQAGSYFFPGLIDNQVGSVTGVAGAIIIPGHTVSTSGTFATITMTAGSTEGTCALTLSNVIVGDAQGQSVSVSIDNGQITISSNQAPVLDSIGDKSVNEEEALLVTISATDPDDDSITYSASNLPSGASFDTDTQTFSWTPTYTQAGTYPSIHFEVTDGNLTDSEDITITINDSNRSPSIGSIGNKSVNEGEALQFTISATDPDDDSMTYSASNLPSGASFDTDTQTFSWTPTYAQAGTYSSVQFEVTDNE
ncbi:MAG: hypothetical protein GY845_04180, partial [Planctomycetes bacterium]|nr:hypothetical protein [Planctomycetota bacterium]